MLASILLHATLLGAAPQPLSAQTPETTEEAAAAPAQGYRLPFLPLLPAAAGAAVAWVMGTWEGLNIPTRVLLTVAVLGGVFVGSAAAAGVLMVAANPEVRARASEAAGRVVH